MSTRRTKSEVTPASKHIGGHSGETASYKRQDKYRKMRRKMAQRNHKINTRGKKSVK